MTRTSPFRRLLTDAQIVGAVAMILVCIGCTSPAARESQNPSLTDPDATQSPDASSPQPSAEASGAALVVKLDGAGEAGRVHVLTVFADGRVLITRPDGQGGIGQPEERRLTAAGIELIRDELAATGLTDASANYNPIPRPGAEQVGYGGAGPAIEVGLPDGGTAVITWYLFADDPLKDYYLAQPEAAVLEALAARLSTLEDWLPADAWVDGSSNAPTIGYEAPDGFLPPNSIVQVVVDRLQLRDEPGLAGPVEGFATKGDRFSVAGWFGPVRRDGLDWYRLGPAIGGDLDAWAAAGSGADTYLEVVQLECPDVDSDLSVLISMNEWDRLSCFGGRSLTLEGTFSCGVCDGTMPGDFAPAWLAHPLFGHFLWADFQAGEGPLRAYIPPDAGIEMATFGSIVRATGHFSDPVSTTCTMSTFDGERATAVDQRTAELYCRERFVLESLEVIGTDPNYRDPYNP